MKYEKFKKNMADLGFALKTSFENSRLETEVIDLFSEKTICILSEQEAFVVTYTNYWRYKLKPKEPEEISELEEVNEMIYKYIGTAVADRDFPTPFFYYLDLDGVFSKNLYLTRCKDPEYPYVLTTSDDVSWEPEFLFTKEEMVFAQAKHPDLKHFKEHSVDRLRY